MCALHILLMQDTNVAGLNGKFLFHSALTGMFSTWIPLNNKMTLTLF